MEAAKSQRRRTLKVRIAPQAPNTTRRLKILEPITLPTAISLLPAREAVVLTASSGALVPNATIVRPIIILGTLSILATDELASTKKSAPLIKSTKPTSSITYTIMFIPFPSFFFSFDCCPEKSLRLQKKRGFCCITRIQQKSRLLYAYRATLTQSYRQASCLPASLYKQLTVMTISHNTLGTVNPALQGASYSLSLISVYSLFVRLSRRNLPI